MTRRPDYLKLCWFSSVHLEHYSESRDIITKFRSFVFVKLERMMRRRLYPQDQRLLDLEHALEQIEKIVKKMELGLKELATYAVSQPKPAPATSPARKTSIDDRHDPMHLCQK